MKTVNWTYKNKQIRDIKQTPKDAYGFVYKIEDEKGKIYFGQKVLWFNRWQNIAKSTYEKLRKKDPKRKDVKKAKNKALSKRGKGGTVWNYKQFKRTESDWKTYTGSCKPLNEKLKKGLLHKKEILLFVNTKKQLSYYENKHLYCFSVLENPDKFWNDCISGKYFTEDLLK